MQLNETNNPYQDFINKVVSENIYTLVYENGECIPDDKYCDEIAEMYFKGSEIQNALMDLSTFLDTYSESEITLYLQYYIYLWGRLETCQIKPIQYTWAADHLDIHNYEERVRKNFALYYALRMIDDEEYDFKDNIIFIVDIDNIPRVGCQLY